MRSYFFFQYANKNNLNKKHTRMLIPTDPTIITMLTEREKIKSIIFFFFKIQSFVKGQTYHILGVDICSFFCETASYSGQGNILWATNLRTCNILEETILRKHSAVVCIKLDHSRGEQLAPHEWVDQIWLWKRRGLLVVQ